jgi:hypothetical protein
MIVFREWLAGHKIFGAVAVVSVMFGWCGKALAECITESLLTAGPPYAEYRLTNTCRGPAFVHWTRKYENKTEQGTWDVGSCTTQDHQYAIGEYSFGEVEFRQGGENDRCVSKDDAAKQEKDPNDKAKSSAEEHKRDGAASLVTPNNFTRSQTNVGSASFSSAHALFHNDIHIDLVRHGNTIDVEAFESDHLRCGLNQGLSMVNTTRVIFVCSYTERDGTYLFNWKASRIETINNGRGYNITENISSNYSLKLSFDGHNCTSWYQGQRKVSTTSVPYTPIWNKTFLDQSLGPETGTCSIQ